MFNVVVISEYDDKVITNKFSDIECDYLPRFGDRFKHLDKNYLVIRIEFDYTYSTSKIIPTVFIKPFNE